MSESENPSPQEKLDAWFASLQLDKPAPLAKEESFFRWCIRKPWRILVAVFGLPIILYGILFAIERFTNLYWICGFTKSEWFSFFGSYLGGVATLIGVVWTILHMNKTQTRQEQLEFIEKDFSFLVQILSKIDIPQFCFAKYQEFSTSLAADKIQHLIHLQEIISSISRYQEEMNSEFIKVSTASNLFGREIVCESCSTQCARYKIKKEFLNVFTQEHFENYKLLERLLVAVKLKFNILNYILITPRNVYGNNIEEKPTDKELEDDINFEQRNSKEVGVLIQERAHRWHTEQFPKLITLVKFYRDEQIKNISSPCPYLQQR